MLNEDRVEVERGGDLRVEGKNRRDEGNRDRI